MPESQPEGAKTRATESLTRNVKTSHHVDKDRGIDGNKNIKDRMKHIVTDVLDLPLAMVIHTANVFDSVGAKEVFKNLADK